MREILFRGKDIAGNWHYGVPLVFTEDYVCITAPHTYNKKVEANTVGQYTGLTDKNGTKIFEGDIIQEVYGDIRYSPYEVKFSEERGGWYPFATDDGCGCCSDEIANTKHSEIIGNIHDNPELLGGDE